MVKWHVEELILHWPSASSSERAGSQPFLIDFCDVLNVLKPDNHPANGYYFEFPVTEHHPDGTVSPVRIDLYKRACFILESKLRERLRLIQTNPTAHDSADVTREISSHPANAPIPVVSMPLQTACHQLMLRFR